MTLLLQLNGNLPERFASHERRLYVFACRSKTCKKKIGSIRAIRGTKIDASSTSSTEKRNAITQGTSPKAPPPMLGDSIFGKASSSSGNANPFSAPNPFASTSSNPFSSLASKPPQPPSPSSDLPANFAQKASISSPSPSSPLQKAPSEPWPPQSECPPYPSYYLEADYETLDNRPSPAATPSKNFDIDSDPSSSGGGAKDDANAYESSMDTTFQKFASRVSHNPLQVLRYEFGGTPLLYSKTDSVGKLLSSASTPRIPRCENCGKVRVFEVQLVPQAIAELEDEEEGLEGMEWGSVVVGVCGGDCGDERGEGWVWTEEWVGVQWEESGGAGVKK